VLQRGLWCGGVIVVIAVIIIIISLFFSTVFVIGFVAVVAAHK
jgi:hypothetical protein